MLYVILIALIVFLTIKAIRYKIGTMALSLYIGSVFGVEKMPSDQELKDYTQKVLENIANDLKR